MIRRSGLISMLALTSYLFCGFSQPAQCNSSGRIGPSTGEVVAAGVGIGAVIAVVVAVPIVISHKHHTAQGCVMTGRNGLEVQQEDNSKPLSLVGDAPGLKVGELVKLHGTKQKKQEGVNQAFVVEKVTKDYGPCRMPSATPVAAGGQLERSLPAGGVGSANMR
jgi:hypothetical protein